MICRAPALPSLFALAIALSSPAPLLAAPQDRLAAAAQPQELDVPADAPLVYAGRTANTEAGESAAYFTQPVRGRPREPLTLWFVDVFATPKDYNGKAAAYAAGRYLFDCEGRRSSLQWGTLHATDGETIAVMDRPQPWKTLSSDDELVLAMDKVCGGQDPVPTIVGVPAMIADAAKRML